MRQCSEKIINETLIEYEYLIRIIISKYKILAKDYDDALQEGRLGLLKAIRAYEDHKGASFNSFASLCIDRQILSFLRNLGRKKNKIHTFSYSLDAYNSEVEVQKKYHVKNDLEDTVINKLHYTTVYQKAIKKISHLEQCVFHQYVTGYSISELSETYNIPKKQVYVIIAKVKKRLAEKLNLY